MQIYLLLTEKCNLRCKMCIRGTKLDSELRVSDLLNLDNLDFLKGNDLVITGGEPTLNSEFKEFIHVLSPLCKTLSICTNGIKNDYIDKDFFKQNIRVQISVDGTKQVHDEIRGANTFDKTFDTINKLESLGIPYIIATVVNKTNIACMFELCDILKQLKNMIWWSISLEMPFGEGRISDIMATDEWNQFVDQLLAYVPFKMKIKKLFPFDLFEKNKLKLDEMYSKGMVCSNCGSGTTKVYIYPDLTVYPCTCLTKFPLGNLRYNTLTDILKSENALKFSNYEISADSKCNSCEYKKYCNGGCIGMSYHYFGKLGCGDIRCPKLKL